MQNSLDLLSLPGWTVQGISDTDEHLFIDALAEAFQSLQQTVEAWKDEIFGFFSTETPLTNAYTERANLSIREATRITYGLSFRVLRAKLLFSASNTAKLKATPPRPQSQTGAPLCVQLTWISTDSGIAST